MRNWARRRALVIGIALLVVLGSAAKPSLGSVAALVLVVIWIAREIRDRRRAATSIAAKADEAPTHCAACGAWLDAGASFCGAPAQHPQEIVGQVDRDGNGGNGRNP